MTNVNRIYLDWNATAPVFDEVTEAMVDVYENVPGNASSVHQEGQTARKVLEDTRRSVASAVNAPSQAVIFTGGATESNNQVIRDHVESTDEPYVICSAIEHPSVLEVVEDLDRRGVQTAIWPVDESGRLEDGWLEPRLEDGATLVSVMYANNEMGNIYPVGDIASLVQEHGAVFHTDATQALGRKPVSFDDIGADFMSLSFHKSGGPKGIGAIVKKEGRTIEQFMAGGHQERGRRPGTENVPAAAGVKALCELISENAIDWNCRLKQRRDYFVEQLTTRDLSYEYRGDPENSLPNTLNLAFPNIDGEDFLLAADLAGLSLSSGSACTAGSLEPSHVILAMGFERGDAKRSVRFSFGPTTTESELERAAGIIEDVYGRLSRVSRAS
jgi:cysteine desulfurase